MKNSCKVTVDQLQIGNFVRLPIAWKDHPFLFSSFKVKQQAQIELIRNLGINHVFVDLDRSDAEPLSAKEVIEPFQRTNTDVLKAEMEKIKDERIEQFKKMRRDLQKAEQNFERSVAMMHNVMNKVRNRPLNAVTDAQDLINTITSQLLNEDNLVLHLMGDAKKDEGMYYHSLNVAVLSMLIGKELGWNRADIELLGMGALFHDVGKLKVPSQILNKKTALTTPEINFMKQHPSMGVEFLRLAENFPESAVPMVLQHHEYLDGTGFPKGLKGDEIDKYAQLITVVNQYDTLCHPGMQTKARTPYAALSYIYKNYKPKLNQEYMGHMIKMLGVYPPGSVVELSSGQFGMVMSVNLGKLLFPRILVYDALVPKDQAPIVDLEIEGLTIVRCLPPSALPEKIFKYLSPRERVSYYLGSDAKK